MQQGGYQIQTPPMTKVNRVVLIMMSACFLVNFICMTTLNMPLGPFLGLSGSGLSDGLLYQLFTYPFITQGFFEVLFSGLLLWFIGSELELLWGSERYGFLLACSVASGALFYGLISFLFFKDSGFFNFPLIGMGGVSSGLCVVYGRLYPDRQFSFMMLIPIKAKYFTWILVGMVLFSGLSTPSGIGAWGQLGAMGGAYFVSMFLFHPSLNGLMDFLSGKRSSSSKPGRGKSSHLSIVREDEPPKEEDRPPRYWQ